MLSSKHQHAPAPDHHVEQNGEVQVPKRQPHLDKKGRVLGPLIAFVGCDGSGKSTVSEAILTWLSRSQPVQSCHLGIQSKQIGERLVRLPLVGKAIGRLIAANSPRGNHKHAQISSGPSTLAAFAIFLLSIRRYRRYQKMMKLRRQGITIVADRFPQIAVANMKIDGPGLLAVKHGNALIRFLAAREKKLYDYMISYRPDLVVRLNVDVETAFARKPDHRYESLALKIANVPKLEYQGAPILDLDSRLPLEEVIAQAKAAVSRSLANP
ncbi:nucleoside triphosphate hydrolase [Pseudomonas sp. SLFW]|uniref:nucleoside triphosphate hydrolase n=1 Tax=Pseudomonas sp. SLFW TaxID=2683259 RepID=UPI002114BC9B|nr:nucleoside triphosphate hydrolase [Pseudomonas sp. SLFW]